jgi:hypothetical protein
METTTEWKYRGIWVHSLAGAEISSTSRPALGHTYVRPLVSRTKRPGHEADHLPLSSAGIENK